MKILSEGKYFDPRTQTPQILLENNEYEVKITKHTRKKVIMSGFLVALGVELGYLFYFFLVS